MPSSITERWRIEWLLSALDAKTISDMIVRLALAETRYHTPCYAQTVDILLVGNSPVDEFLSMEAPRKKQKSVAALCRLLRPREPRASASRSRWEDRCQFDTSIHPVLHWQHWVRFRRTSRDPASLPRGPAGLSTWRQCRRLKGMLASKTFTLEQRFIEVQADLDERISDLLRWRSDGISANVMCVHPPFPVPWPTWLISFSLFPWKLVISSICNVNRRTDVLCSTSFPFSLSFCWISLPLYTERAGLLLTRFQSAILTKSIASIALSHPLVLVFRMSIVLLCLTCCSWNALCIASFVCFVLVLEYYVYGQVQAVVVRRQSVVCCCETETGGHARCVGQIVLVCLTVIIRKK
jgi:hypothetical protein